MILGHEESKILQLATDYQSEMTDGVVQYDYETGELFGAGFTTGTTENPANPFIEVFRLSQGESGEIDCNCDGCPFRYEDERYPDWEKYYPETREECCMDAYIDNDFIGDFENNFRESVEVQISEVLKDHIGETLEKLNEIRIGISDIVTPHNYYNVRQDDWEMRVIDNLVDMALEEGFTTEITPLQYLGGEISNIITTDYNPSLEEMDGEEKINEAIGLLGDGKLDEALECLK